MRDDNSACGNYEQWLPSGSDMEDRYPANIHEELDVIGYEAQMAHVRLNVLERQVAQLKTLVELLSWWLYHTKPDDNEWRSM